MKLSKVLIPLWIERTGRETKEHRRVQQQRKVSLCGEFNRKESVSVQSKAIVALSTSMSDRSGERKRSRNDSDSEVDDPLSNNRRGCKIAAPEAMDVHNKASKKSRSLVPAGSSDGAVSLGSQAATAAASIARFHDICNLDVNADLPDYVKQHANTLTFPEKVSRVAVQMSDVLLLVDSVSFVSNPCFFFFCMQLMLTLTHVEKVVSQTGAEASEQSIGWVLEGNAFVIRDKDLFCSQWLPTFFGQAKFSSFTRKLYRWGFRKVNMAPHHDVDGSAANTYFFGNENFQRDNKELLSQMKSVTAAKTRTEQAQEIKKRDMSVPDAALGPVPSNMAVQQQQQQSALPQSLVAPSPLQAYLASWVQEVRSTKQHYFKR